MYRLASRYYFFIRFCRMSFCSFISYCCCGEFSLALDCEFVVGDLVEELANGVGGVFGGEEAVEMGDYGTL